MAPALLRALRQVNNEFTGRNSVSISPGQALRDILSHLKLEKCTNPELKEQMKREENLYLVGGYPGRLPRGGDM